MEISELYKLFLNYPLICTDTRDIRKGAIFFALKGELFNGNEFAESAIKNGCEFAVIDQEKYKIDERFIYVQNVLETLQELAKYHRSHIKIPVLGITGTNGKTTTKELVSAILETKFKIISTKGNLNNHIGVPLTVLSITQNTEIAVVEMGANHSGEIEFLCKIAQPTHGIITNIGKAHLEGFGSFEGVIKTKKELYDFIITNDGIVFANSDNELLIKCLNNFHFVAYGTSTKASCRGKIIGDKSILEAEISLDNFETNNKQISSCNFSVSSNLIGGYNLENLLAAVTIGGYFGVDSDKISEAIYAYRPDNNRSQLKKTNKNVLILDAYNANPSSMTASLKNFASINEVNKIVVLGDMLELGEYSIQEHSGIIDLLKINDFQKVILVGNVFSNVAKDSGFQTFENIDALCLWIGKNAIENAYILIKGSRGIKLEKVIPFL